MIVLTAKGNAVCMPVWVQPGASQDRIVGEHDGCLKVAVTAPPEGGRANKAVARLLASEFAIRKSAVEIISGATARRKQVAITGISLEHVRQFCEQVSRL